MPMVDWSGRPGLGARYWQHDWQGFVALLSPCRGTTLHLEQPFLPVPSSPLLWVDSCAGHIVSGCRRGLDENREHLLFTMSALGQNATWPVFRVKSVLPPMSDILAGLVPAPSTICSRHPLVWCSVEQSLAKGRQEAMLSVLARA